MGCSSNTRYDMPEQMKGISIAMNKLFLKRSLRFQIITVVLIAIIVPTLGLFYNLMLSNSREKIIIQDNIVRIKDTNDYIDKELTPDKLDTISKIQSKDEDTTQITAILQDITAPLINANRTVKVGFYHVSLKHSYTFGRPNKVIGVGSNQDSGDVYFDKNINSQTQWSINNREDRTMTSQDNRGVIIRYTHPIFRNDEVVMVVWQEVPITDDILVDRKMQNYIWIFVFSGTVIGILLTFIILRNMIANMNKVIKGLEAMEKDLGVRIEPINGEFGRIAKSINVMRNALLEKEKLEERLRKTEKLVALGQLVSGVAHEIRNPLGIIRATVQVMEKEFSEMEELKEYIRVVKEQSDRENKVIQELLDYARPSKTKLQITNMNEVIESTLTFTKYYVQDKHIEIEVDCSNNLPPILIDEQKIKQVFINLIINACDAMSKGGRLNIETFTEQQYSCIRFADNGIGMDEAQIKNIFNPYYTTKARGTGLGLTISNGIIEMHGGYIDVKSVKGEGSEFTVHLPLSKGDSSKEDRNG